MEVGGAHGATPLFEDLYPDNGDRGVSWIVINVDTSHCHLKEGTSVEKKPPSEWPRCRSVLYVPVSD